MNDILKRLVELVKEDKELHDAIVVYIQSMTIANLELAKWRERRDAE